MESKRLTKITCLGILIISLLLSVYLEIFMEASGVVVLDVRMGFAFGRPELIHILRLAAMFVAIGAAGYLLWRHHPAFLSFVYKHRYIIALALLVLLVALEISGSSIGYWRRILGANSSTGGTLFGMPRGIRSDEYAVFTPFNFSQYYNHAGAYPYFSETIRGTLTDTFIVYGQPSWDIGTVFRPSLWGYLLLGPAKGLAFFWVARFLALFFVSFEFAMVYTKRDKWLSLAAALLISLAPIVQWWFAINGLVEMLVFGQGALLCVNHYMKTGRTGQKVIAGLLFFWCGGVYVLTFYPAWQIPLGYVFLALLVYIVLENKRHFTFDWKKDVPIIAGSILLLALSLAYVFLKSQDTIHTVMSTAYPGARVGTGGGGFLSLFKYGAGLFLPVTDNHLPANTCEAAAFFDLFPLGILLSCIVIFREKKRDRMLIPLLAVQAVLLAFCVLGFPVILAKITLLSNTMTNRAVLAVGFVNILLLIRSLAVMEWKPRARVAVPVSLGLAVVVGLLCRGATGDYLNPLFIAAVFAVLFAGFAAVSMIRHNNAKKLFVLYCALVGLVGGLLVNPVQRGTDVLYKNDVVQTVQKVADKDDGLWIVEDVFPITNISIMAGAPTINSTNVYPALDRWKLLDPEGKHQEIYNRYAHIAVDLTEEDTRFEYIGVDYFRLRLSFKDVQKLDVKYILTKKDYANMKNRYVTFTPKGKSGQFKVYEVIYNEDRT